MKRGKGVRERTGLEGERGGKNEGKGREETGPKAHSKSSDFGTPMIYHRVLQGAPPEGRQIYFVFQVLQTLSSLNRQSVKSTFP